MRKKNFPCIFASLLATAWAAMPLVADDATDYRAHPAFAAFAEKLTSSHGYEAAEINAIFSGVTRRQGIIDLITRPAESKAWHEYHPIFLTDARIEAGVRFREEHAEELARAEREFGVEQEIIVAIIGVETFYGRVKGSWRVIDALATLGFDYPPRQRFFISELENFLLLIREESIDPHTVTGSYAGAMGGGQFMPSSYRAYAVDFDGDGRRDLWNSWSDVIGSVANYLAVHGWRHGESIALPAALPANREAPVTRQGMERFKASELRERGMVFSESVAGETDLRLVGLQHEDELAYWIGLHNFGVLNRYNRSPLYAMVVVDLARAIRAQ